MSGLFQKAQALRSIDQGFDGESSPDFDLSDQEGISAEEQQEIISEIERMAAESRITLSPAHFAIRAEKKGVLFPLFINIAALILLAAGIFGLYFLFQRGESRLIQEEVAITTAEGKLIEELKKESEAKLEEKNRQISQIQGRLATIDKEREDLLTNMESRVREREEELRRALEAELEAERARLQEQGVSEVEIELKLQALEEEKALEFNQQLQAFKREAEAERAQMEENLRALKLEYEQSLTRASRERNDLLEEARKREEELRAQLAEKTRALDTERAQAQAELERISELREDEELVEDHIIGLYDQVRAGIQAGRYDQAMAGLENLSTYLNDEAVLNLPGVLKRREVEFFVIDSLRDLIEGERGREEMDTASLIASANLVTDVRAKVLRADRLIAQGNITEAEQLYRESLEAIPAIERSHRYFLAREQESEAEGRQRLEQHLGQADAAFEQGEYAEALDRYTRTLAYLSQDTASIDWIVSRIARAGYELEQGRLQRRDSSLAAASLAEADRLLAAGRSGEALRAYTELINNYPRSNQVEAAVRGISRAAEAQRVSVQEDVRGLEQTLEQRTAALEQELENKIARIETLQAENENLEQRLGSLQAEIGELGTAAVGEVRPSPESLPQGELERRYRSITERYSGYAEREDRVLEEKGKEGLVESKLYLNNFLAFTAVEEAFPGLLLRIRRYDLAFEEAGRSSAINDVLEIAKALALRDLASERERILNREIENHRNDPLMVSLLQELKEVVLP